VKKWDRKLVIMQGLTAD